MKTNRFFILTAIICVASLFSVDLAYGYHPVSPYAYCLNNPVKYVDPKGEDVWEINANGEIMNRIKDKTQDAFYMVDANNKRMQDANGVDISVSFKYGTIESQTVKNYSSNGNTGTYDLYQVRGDGNGTALFQFMSDNVTGATGVEFSQFQTGVAGDKGLNFITTSHEVQKDSGAKGLLNSQLNQGYVIRQVDHSHPNSAYPSGLKTRNADIGVVTAISAMAQYWGYPTPSYNIYHVPTRTYIPYGPNSTPAQFGIK